MRVLTIPAMLILLVACGPEPQEPPPPPTTTVPTPPPAPDGASFVLDNDYIKALLFELQPGQGQSDHDGPARLVYSLNDYTIEWKEGEAEPEEKSWKAGDAHWHTAGLHVAKNLGEEVARYLVVARTEMALPTQEEQPEAPAEIGEVVFENANVKLVELKLDPGETTPKHWAGPRMIYALGDYTIRWTEGDAEPVEKSFETDQAHWHAAAEHVVENIGETPARFLVITFVS
jgi:hypothetical protein